MKNNERVSAATALAALATMASVVWGCGGAAKEVKTGEEKPGPVVAQGPSPAVAAPARERFNAALDAFNGHDKANDWSDASCSENARLFEAAAAAQSSGEFPAA